MLARLTSGTHSPQVWGAPGAKSRNIMKATSSTSVEVHGSGQTEVAQQERSWSGLVLKSGQTTKMEQLPEDLGSPLLVVLIKV